MDRPKTPKPRLIDTSVLALPKVIAFEPKPEIMFRSRVHGDWIATLPCVLCGRFGCQRCHLRLGTHTAMGETPHDYWLWPGDVACHKNLQHIIGEKSFWYDRLGIADPNRHILLSFSLLSPCPRTVAAGREELERRYGAEA
jgi:hypothetical protein